MDPRRQLRNDWSVVYVEKTKSGGDSQTVKTHRGPGPRPLLDNDLCHIALKQLKVKHVNSRKKERLANAEELVAFLVRMREEHRDRDASRDLYEACRFAKFMPSEDFLAPAPPPLEYVALLDDAGREYVRDESSRRLHRRPSRPVDALMVLMQHRAEYLEVVVPGAGTKEEGKESGNDDGGEKKEDDDNESGSDNNSDVSSDNESDDDQGRKRTTASLVRAHGLKHEYSRGSKESIFFEHRRIAAADVVARMDGFCVLQRPKLFVEMLAQTKPFSYEEFHSFATEAQRTMKTRAVLRRIFDLIDIDGSNDLSKQELLYAFTRSREVRRTVHQLEGLKTMQDPHLFEQAFDAIDSDGDGSASFEELVQFALTSGAGGSVVLEDDDDDGFGDSVEENVEELVKINGETIDDKWDALRRQEGALPDHDPMYLPDQYSNDDANETTDFIYEELHDLYEIFDRMWDGVSTDKPKDPYEHIIQVLRSEQRTRRLRLGIDLTLTDINEPLPLDLRRKLYACCERDDTVSLGKLLEIHQLSLDHRCFYVVRGEGGARGDGVKGYGWELDPAYHRAYDSTLLHASSWFGSDKVLTWLLERGADAVVKDIMLRTARDVAGSDPIRLLLHTRTLGRVWKDTHNPFEVDLRMASFSRWRKRKQRSNAPQWQPKASHRMSAIEKRFGTNRVEEEDESAMHEADLQSQARIKSGGGTQAGHAMMEVDESELIGAPGAHLDPKLHASGLLPYPNNTTYDEHAHDDEGKRK